MVQCDGCWWWFKKISDLLDYWIPDEAYKMLSLCKNCFDQYPEGPSGDSRGFKTLSEADHLAELPPED